MYSIIVLCSLFFYQKYALKYEYWKSPTIINFSRQSFNYFFLYSRTLALDLFPILFILIL